MKMIFSLLSALAIMTAFSSCQDRRQDQESNDQVQNARDIRPERNVSGGDSR